MKDGKVVAGKCKCSEKIFRGKQFLTALLIRFLKSVKHNIGLNEPLKSKDETKQKPHSLSCQSNCKAPAKDTIS